jgi:hypothetical protein
VIDRLLHLVFGCHCPLYGGETVPCINLCLHRMCADCRAGHPGHLSVAPNG